MFGNTLSSVIVSLIPLALSSGLLFTLSNSILSKATPHRQTGETLGLSSAVGSLSHCAGPVLAGYCAQTLGYKAIGPFAATTTALITVYFLLKPLPTVKKE
jgi:MFS family permease